ncbi:glycerophosphoryl diester phosphodiesterase membrane domain-containing protein [Isoptericola aurantiacus]|uniref:glycerophosphoryl diester phosphodiesterase membrane domain-containing protein n=1 Tax=Isoptericola aurantiacus TaxID=3377839 RepID=UPI00383AB217
MSTPDQPPPPSGWGDAPRPPTYGQYGQGQYGQGRYGAGPQDTGGPAGYPPPAAGAPNPYGPSAAKPGVVPLRPLSLGEVFDGAFSSVRHNPAVMLGLVTIVVAAATVLATLLAQFAVPALTGLMTDVFAADPATANLYSGDVAAVVQVMAIAGALTLTLLFAQPIAEGVITVSVSQSVIGRKLSVGEVWTRVRPRLGVLIGWMLLRSVAVLVGYVVIVVVAVLLVAAVASVVDSPWAAVLLGLLLAAAIVVGVVWLVVRLLLVVPALVLEGGRLGATLARAWRLTRRGFWRILGTVLLASIIAGVAGQVVGYPLALLGLAIDGGSFGWGFVLVTVVSSVISTLVYLVFVSGVVALVYTDARMRREGLDVRLAESAARVADGRSGPTGNPGPAGPPTPPPTGTGTQW